MFTSKQVDIFYTYGCIALNKREYKRNNYTASYEHLLSAHNDVTDCSQEKFVEDLNQSINFLNHNSKFTIALNSRVKFFLQVM